MYVYSVTIATSNTAQRIVPKSSVIDNSNTSFQNLFLQNNGTHTMYLGDSAVTPTNSLQLGPSGNLAAPLALSYASDLKDFYVYGTAGDVLNIMVFP